MANTLLVISFVLKKINTQLYMLSHTHTHTERYKMFKNMNKSWDHDIHNYRYLISCTRWNSKRTQTLWARRCFYFITTKNQILPASSSHTLHSLKLLLAITKTEQPHPNTSSKHNKICSHRDHWFWSINKGFFFFF